MFYVGAGKSGGSKLKQITVTKNGVSNTYREHNGAVYRVQIGNVLSGKGSSRSLSEIQKKATEAGYSVKTYTRAEYKQYEAQYKKNREKTNEQLNRAWYEAAPRPRKGMKGH